MKKHIDYYFVNSYMSKNYKNSVYFLIVAVLLNITMCLYFGLTDNKKYLNGIWLFIVLGAIVMTFIILNAKNNEYDIFGRVHINKKCVVLSCVHRNDIIFSFEDIVCAGIQYGRKNKIIYYGEKKYDEYIRLYISTVQTQKCIEYNPGLSGVALGRICKELNIWPVNSELLYHNWLGFEVTLEDIQKIKELMPDNLREMIEEDEIKLNKFLQENNTA